MPGNHGRSTKRNEDEPACNSFDYHLARIMEVVFQDEKRIQFMTSESWYYLAKVRGWRYLLHHGDTVYSWMSLPYYGIVRQSKSRRIAIPFDIECIAHFHTRMEIPTGGHTYTLVNGSFISKDAYAWRKFGALSKAEQTFFGVSNKRPRTWNFSLELEK